MLLVLWRGAALSFPAIDIASRQPARRKTAPAAQQGQRRCAAPVPVMKSFFLNARFYVSSLLMVIIFSGPLRLAAS